MIQFLTTICMRVNVMAQIEGKSNGTNLNNFSYEGKSNGTNLNNYWLVILSQILPAPSEYIIWVLISSNSDKLSWYTHYQYFSLLQKNKRL